MPKYYFFFSPFWVISKTVGPSSMKVLALEALLVGRVLLQAVACEQPRDLATVLALALTTNNSNSQPLFTQWWSIASSIVKTLNLFLSPLGNHFLELSSLLLSSLLLKVRVDFGGRLDAKKCQATNSHKSAVTGRLLCIYRVERQLYFVNIFDVVILTKPFLDFFLVVGCHVTVLRYNFLQHNTWLKLQFLSD